MEVVIESDTPVHGEDLILLICKRGKRLFVTRSLLTRTSMYFAAILSEHAGWQESSKRTVELEAWPRSDLADIMLSLKNKEPKPIFEDMDRYFVAINYFGITSLIDQCIEYRINNMSGETIIDDINFAARFSHHALEEKCMEYLLRKLPEVLHNSRHSRRKMSAELLEKCLRDEKLLVRNEDEVLSLIDVWSSAGPRQSERKKLLHCVQFSQLTRPAFEKCCQDAQCLEIPQFRRLLETPRWSDLGEDLLPRRNLKRTHYHIAGVLRQRQRDEECPKDGLLVFCSEKGAVNPAGGAFSEAYAFALTDRVHSVMYGNALYVFKQSEEFYCVPREFHRVPLFSDYINELRYFADYRDPEPSSITRFPRPIFTAAPPAAFENDLIIVHVLYRAEAIRRGSANFLQMEHFYGIEILRYHHGESISKRFPLPIACDSQPDLIRNMLNTRANKLFVNDEWMILIVPQQGALIVLDAPRPTEPIIEIPEKYWDSGRPHVYMVQSLCDMVVVGNVAFILVICEFYEEGLRLSDREWLYLGEISGGTILAYDLSEGKWLPELALDLAPFYRENLCRSRTAKDSYDFFLKVVLNEVFLVILADRTEPRESGYPAALVHYVYRLERSADGLQMSPASERAAAGPIKSRASNAYQVNFAWKGIPLNIDAHPCEYATALQLKASGERDPIEREKLRRFFW